MFIVVSWSLMDETVRGFAIFATTINSLQVFLYQLFISPLAMSFKLEMTFFSNSQ